MLDGVSVDFNGVLVANMAGGNHCRFTEDTHNRVKL
jgi:hypothetical protein